jgi:hypothetical protein
MPLAWASFWNALKTLSPKAPSMWMYDTVLTGAPACWLSPARLSAPAVPMPVASGWIRNVYV